MLAMKTKTISYALAVLALAACGGTPEKKTYPTLGSIERLDPRLDALLAAGAKIEVLAEGFEWTEGPVWVPQGRFVLFSDIPNNVVHKWKEGEGLSTYLKPAGYTGNLARGGEMGSNGLLLDPQGRLVLCQHGDRRMARLDAPVLKPQTKYYTLADRYQGKRFNSPNDACYDSRGALYFTDPPYGLEKRMEDPSKELDFQGVYRLGPAMDLTLLSKDLSRPNGIALSPDERTLYVANSDPERAIWMAYPITTGGMLGQGRVFFDATTWVKQKKGLPDGLKVDKSGNLWATGPGGVLIFAPDGAHLGTIQTGEATANCAFGDDGGTLYITADMYLLRVRTTTRGRGF